MPISRMAGAMGLPTGKGRVWNSINQTLASNLLATGRDLRDPQLFRSRKCLEQHKSNPFIYWQLAEIVGIRNYPNPENVRNGTKQTLAWSSAGSKRARVLFTLKQNCIIAHNLFQVSLFFADHFQKVISLITLIPSEF